MNKILKSKAFTFIFFICLILLWLFIQMGGFMGEFTAMEEKYKFHMPRGVKLEGKHLREPSFRGDGTSIYVLSTKKNMDNTILDTGDMKDALTKEQTEYIEAYNRRLDSKKATEIKLDHSLKVKELNHSNDHLLIIYDETIDKYYLVDVRI